MANHEIDVGDGPLVPPPSAFNVNLDGLGGEGGLFTLGLGADYQIHRRFLVGAFFDYDWMDVSTEINASLSDFGDSARASAEFEVKDQWSIGGRIGYLPTARTLLFISAGYTQVDVTDLTFTASVTGLGSGSGVLASVDDSLGHLPRRRRRDQADRRDLDQGRVSLHRSRLGGGDVAARVWHRAINDFVSTELDPTIQTARVTLNYRFGLGHAPRLSQFFVDAPPADNRGWTGLYLGVGGGYGSANHEIDVSDGPLVPPPSAFNVNLDGLGGEGGLFTLGLGADYQIHRRFLVGAFFDYDWMDVEHGDHRLAERFWPQRESECGVRGESQWSLGGRIGYLAPLRARCCFSPPAIRRSTSAT